MKKSTKRLFSALGIAAGAFGAGGAYLKRKNMATQQGTRKQVGDVWARPGMLVTFRAELMPGRDRQDRTFRIKELLPSGRVLLHGVDGEHAEKEFDPLQTKRRSS
jgi:hypothetical protein